MERWVGMSALGQKQTSRHLQPTTAFPPKADIGTQPLNVRFVPKADISVIEPSCRSPSGDDLSAMRFKVDCGSQTFCGQDYHRGGAPSWCRKKFARVTRMTGERLPNGRKHRSTRPWSSGRAPRAGSDLRS